MTNSKRIVRRLTTAMMWLNRKVAPYDDLPAADIRKLHDALIVANKLLKEKR